MHSRASNEKNALTGLKPVSDECFSSDILDASEPVVVDFAADYCGPGRRGEPALLRLDTKPGISGRKAKRDGNTKLRTWLLTHGIKITALPTLVLVREGVPVRSMFGADKILRESVLHSFAFDSEFELPPTPAKVCKPKPAASSKQRPDLLEQLGSRLGLAL